MARFSRTCYSRTRSTVPSRERSSSLLEEIAATEEVRAAEREEVAAGG